jgi:Immunoglobulin I-set domain
VVKQTYKPEVQTTSGFLGSNVLLKCNVPSFVADYVKTVSWLQEPNFNIYPSLKTDASDKYHMLPTGELIIVNVSHSDADKLYKCRTYHKLLNELSISMNSGKIHLTDSRELVPPIMDRKILKVSAKTSESLLIPCISYANPNPSYQWFVKSDNQEQRIDLGHHLGRFRERQNGLLFITNVEEADSNTYYCTAKNSEGSETLEIQLTVISPLSVHIHPQKQTIDLGKSASLVMIGYMVLLI